MPAACQIRVAPAVRNHCSRCELRTPQAFEVTLLLDGITSDDYIQWIRDPDPPSPLGLELIAVRTAPLDDHIRLKLVSAGDPPPAASAASAVGFPITAEVIRVHSTQSPGPGGAGSENGSAEAPR